jgi:hypothetical protein
VRFQLLSHDVGVAFPDHFPKQNGPTVARRSSCISPAHAWGMLSDAALNY